MKFLINIVIVLLASGLNLLAQSSFSADRLEDIVTNYIQNNLNNLNSDIVIEFPLPIKSVKLKEDGIKAKIENYNYSKGLVNINLAFYSNDKKIHEQKIRANVFIEREFPVAGRTLPLGTMLSENDLSLQSIRISPEKTNDYLDKSSLLGEKISRTIAKNLPFTKDMLLANAIIKRGDKVDIIVQSGAVAIHTRGAALQEGSVGQTIRVKREGNTSQVLEGVVNSDGSIFINAR